MTIATNAWGYMGIEVCVRHTSSTRADHLFAHSAYESRVACVPCWVGRYDLEPPTADEFPILDMGRKCQVCGKPEAEGHRATLISAYLNDDTEILVHRYACSYDDACHDCKKTFAREGWEHDRIISGRRFSYVAEIDFYSRCTQCSNTYIAEHGGDSRFFSCGNCENMFHDRNRATFNGSAYCSNCFDNNVYECRDCGASCWDGSSHDCSDGVIHDYSHKPTPKFFGEGSYHMGFELEVEAMESDRYRGAVHTVEALGEHAYLKSDGSLSDGFEIVTHPHTLHEYQKNFDWMVLHDLREQGFRSWDTTTCGLHVHVSREAFGATVSYTTKPSEILRRQAHELRFMKLIYDNQRQVQRIAGRSSGYASFADKGNLIPKVKNGHQSQGHSSAVNTDNYATLEIRVFKGSLRKARVLSALEFVTACVEYTRDLHVSGENKALSWLRFTAYVSTASESYPNLALIMSETFERDTDPSDNEN